MTWIDLIYAGAIFASALATILAWVAKLWWSKEYAAAKDETIRAKDAQIAALEAQLDTFRELTPMKIREYFVSVKDQLEEYNDMLKKQVEEKDRQIEVLRSGGEFDKLEVERLQNEKEALLERRREAGTASEEANKLLSTFLIYSYDRYTGLWGWNPIAQLGAIRPDQDARRT